MDTRKKATTVLLLVFLIPFFGYWYAVNKKLRGLVMTAITILGTTGATYFFGLYIGLAISLGVSIPLLYRDITRIDAKRFTTDYF